MNAKYELHKAQVKCGELIVETEVLRRQNKELKDRDAESSDMLVAAHMDGFYQGETSMFKKLLPFLKHSQNCKESFSPFCQCGLEEIIQKYGQRK